MSEKQKIIIILGPTASGKTALSIDIARKYNNYIISADSRQIYTDMNIGTAKPKGIHQSINTGIQDLDNAYYIDNIPHFLIDFITPDTKYSLSDWQQQTKTLLDSENVKDKFSTPMIVGGTGLYINSITDEYSIPSGKTDEALRLFLDNKSLEELQQDLLKQCPQTYKIIDKNNKRRVVRALEYVMTNKQPFIGVKNKANSKYDILQIGIQVDREILYQNINKRVDKMISDGLIDEVKNLITKYPPTLPSLSGIGYTEIISYLHNEITLDTAIEKIKQHSRNYAKRQMTWFKRNNRIKWIENLGDAINLTDKFLAR